MAQLNQMRLKINTIESIKKITHAMRLISMSQRMRLNHKAPFMQSYKEELSKLLKLVESANKPQDQEEAYNSQIKRNLIVIVGSQKGLAGTFNSSLFRLLEKKITPEQYSNTDFITVGKKASDFIKKRVIPIKTYDNFGIQTIYKVSAEIFSNITEAAPKYTQVIFYVNKPKNFFVQIPEEFTLIPFKYEDTQSNNSSKDFGDHNTHDMDEYIWEQPIQEVFDYMIKEYMYFTVQYLLFNSLVAEQAARFRSMDNATNNADELLKTLKLQYNKIRQTKITKEITELSTNI